MLDLMAYNYGCAAGDKGTADGAQHLLGTGFFDNIAHSLHQLSCFSSSQMESATADVAILSDRLAGFVEQAVNANKFFMTLGGDHSCGIGSWSGASAATDRLGLLWVDAHLDSHTPQSSPSQNIHGMPVAALLGEGEARLCAAHYAGPKIKGEDLCIFGARSFEDPELDLLQRHNVRIFMDQELKDRGFDVCLQEAMSIITNNTSAIGLSLDVDGIDPEFAPAVGTPAAGGLHPQQVMAIIDSYSQHNWIGMEIAEFNPHNDVEQRTEKMLLDLLAHVFYKLPAR